MTLKFIALALAVSSVAIRRDVASAFMSPSCSFLPSGAGVSCDRQRRHLLRSPSQSKCHRRRDRFSLFGTASDLEVEVSSMRVGAIKQELESYGISTRTFLEKGELVEALVEARREGRTPAAGGASGGASSATASNGGATASSGGATAAATAATSPADRAERVRAESERCKSMKVGELKTELESYGVSTNTFFEKSEFVRALAEARVDGVKKSKKKKRRAAATADDDEEVEEVKAKVEVITNDSVGPRTKKTRDAGEGAGGGGNPFGAGAGGSPFGASAGGSPFGGAAGGSPFGGGGGMDMGNIADMLKGMGGMGGAGGGNPFGGAAGGGNPFGGGGAGGMDDAMKAAQQAMSNPRVMAVIQKAQKNPKVMKAVQECMGNPMAMGKYMSDPEVGPILRELQDAMT